jgi:hypothetical protein
VHARLNNALEELVQEQLIADGSGAAPQQAVVEQVADGPNRN